MDGCFMDEIREFIKSRRKVNLLMVLANLAVFLVFSIIGDTEDVQFMVNHGACYTPAILDGEYYRLFTGMFLHFGIYHLINNMICLIFLGDYLETIVGPVKYLLIYLGGGLAGNLFSMGMEQSAGGFYKVSAGASGAIFAVMGALLYIMIRNKGRLGNIPGRGLVMMAGLSVLQGFTATGTDNMAHIGGLAGGFVAAVLLYRLRSRE